MSRSRNLENAQELIKRFNWFSSFSSSYYLDFHFPSLGVIDLLLFHLRGAGTKNEHDKELLNLVASFLGEYLCRTWEDCDLKSNLIYQDQAVVISVEGVSGRPIELISLLSSFLLSLPSTIELTQKELVPVAAESDLIPLLVQAILNGTYFESTAENDLVFSSEFKESLTKSLAKQFARYCENAFPDNPLVQMPELYARLLKRPHYLLSKEAPFLAEVKSFIEYFKEMGVDPAMAARKVRDCFLLIPSETLNLLGLILYSDARRLDDLNQIVLSNARLRSYVSPLIRNAAKFYRTTIIDSGLDWEAEGVELDVAVGALEVEIGLGFLPWIKMDPRVFFQNLRANNTLREYHKFILDGDFSSSMECLDTYLEMNPANLDFRIQRLFYYYLSREFELGHEYAKRLLTEHNIERKPYFFLVWGMILVASNQAELAGRYLSTALSMAGSEVQLKGEVINLLAWSKILLGDTSGARASMVEGFSFKMSEWVSLRLNYLYTESDPVEAKNLIKNLTEICPLDRRVFANILLRVGR